MTQFESNIKYKNGRYGVRLAWKFEPQELNNNNKVAKVGFNRLRKKFQKNPDLFFEYREVLHNYVKKSIIELKILNSCLSYKSRKN